MRPFVIISSLWSIVLVAPATAAELFVNSTFEQALERAGDEGKVVMVDFFTEWCVPCKQLDRTTWADADVQAFLTEHTVPLKLDADQHPELRRRYRVGAYPTMLFIHRDGTERGRLTGYIEPEAFVRRVRVEIFGERNWFADVAVTPSLDDEYVANFQIQDAQWEGGLARVRAAESLSRVHRHADALDALLYAYQDDDPLTAAARDWVVVPAIGELAAQHPPARVALRELRSTALQRVRDGSHELRDLRTIGAIDRALGEVEASLTLLDELKAQGRDDAAHELGRELIDLLALRDEHVRAAAAIDLRGSAESLTRERRRLVRLGREYKLDAVLAQAVVERIDARLAAHYEVMLAVGRDEDAAHLRAEFLGASHLGRLARVAIEVGRVDELHVALAEEAFEKTEGEDVMIVGLLADVYEATGDRTRSERMLREALGRDHWTEVEKELLRAWLDVLILKSSPAPRDEDE